MHRVNAKPRRSHICVAAWDGNGSVKSCTTRLSSLTIPPGIMGDERKPVTNPGGHERLLRDPLTRGKDHRGPAHDAGTSFLMFRV
jgi:hypothetical protein